VLASAGGTVAAAKVGGYNGGYGNMIIIIHPNNVQTVYAHLRSVNVVSGQTVAQGEQIGTVGNTGRSTGPHLHFEVRGAKNPF
jgi:murein DD-endopeptidase MepM/ murein hydrolase activator NlpD